MGKTCYCDKCGYDGNGCAFQRCTSCGHTLCSNCGRGHANCTRCKKVGGYRFNVMQGN